ncbi:MAG: hypothetical protein NTW64_02300 [Candidatus Omnitrophica bacterium]|nr:hypothetical protein [Candidatus Omnitrophota bacterium]
MRKLSKPIIFLLLFSVSLIIYSNILSGDFIWDDKVLILNNEYIKNIKYAPLFFTTDSFRSSADSLGNRYTLYRPINLVSLAIDYRIWGFSPFGYHLTNILIHALNAFLIFYFIYGLFSSYPLAILTCFLFCVHPLHTEAVSWITARAELLVSLFTLISLISYIGYARTGKGIKYLISLFSFILALLSREAGFLIFFPLSIIVIGLASKIPRKTIILNSFCFIGILAIYTILRLNLIVPMQLYPAASKFPFWHDVLNFLLVLTEYIKLLIFPHSLHILRSIKPIVSYHPVYIILPVSLLIFLTVALIASIRQKKYIFLFGAGWFLLALLYVGRIMYYRDANSVSAEEHWIYLASAGFFVILAKFILSFKKPAIVKILSAAIIAFYASTTFINNNHWKEEIGFYRYNLKFIDQPISIMPRIEFASVLYQHSLYSEAIDQIDLILSADPQSWIAYVQLGDTFKAMRRFSEAKEAYEKALRIDYFCWQAYRRLKVLAGLTGEQFCEGIDPGLSPDEYKVVFLIRMGHFGKALEALQDILSVSQGPEFYTLSGITFFKMGMYDRAIEAFNAALSIDKDYLPALNSLAMVYKNFNLPKESISHNKKH